MNFLIGWGSEYFTGPASRILQEISISIWDNIRCQKSWRVWFGIDGFNLPDTMLCAGGELGRDTCQVNMSLIIIFVFQEHY